MSPSTELVIKNPQTVAPKTSALAITGDLEQQVLQMELAHRLSTSLCKTQLVPKHFRDKPDDGAVAIMAGAKWGLDAISSLQNIFIVHGTPSTFAKVMKAVTIANGHKIWTVESSATKVVVRGKRSDSDEIEESIWTIEKAKDAGYFTNSKYRTEPENMLWARATAECSRRTAPDALLGMPYSKEELADVELMRVASERVDNPESDPLREAAMRGTTTAAPAEESVTVDLDSLLSSVAAIGNVQELQDLWINNRDLLEGDPRQQLSDAVTARLSVLRAAAAAAEAANAPEPVVESDPNAPVDAEAVDEPVVDRSDEVAELFAAEVDANL